MKKFLMGFLIALVALAAAVYFGVNFVLEKASREALRALTSQAKNFELDILQADFSGVRVSSFDSVTWKNFRLHFNLMKDGAPDPDKAYTLQIEDATVKLAAAAKSLIFSGRGILVTSSAAMQNSSGKLEGETFTIDFKVGEFEPKTIARRVREASRELIEDMSKNASTLIPVEFSGKATFLVEGKPSEVGVRMERNNGAYALVMDKQDLRSVSASLTEKLTNAEIDFLSEHPVQAPQLLRIKERAQNISRQAHERDANVPEDAYRHILWSYLLTKEFDEAFAEKMTDAHEKDEVTETDADHRMDLNNNAVGRAYARAGTDESRILEQLTSDPNVILTP